MFSKSSGTLAAGFLGLALTCGFAQDRATDTTKGQTASTSNATNVVVGQEMTVTGCVSKEAKEKNEYLITGEDGRTWGMKSSAVKLADHLNHKVTITGKVTKKEHEGKEAGDLKVTNLQMVSQTCP